MYRPPLFPPSEFGGSSHTLQLFGASIISAVLHCLQSAGDMTVRCMSAAGSPFHIASKCRSLMNKIISLIVLTIPTPIIPNPYPRVSFFNPLLPLSFHPLHFLYQQRLAPNLPINQHLFTKKEKKTSFFRGIFH